MPASVFDRRGLFLMSERLTGAASTSPPDAGLFAWADATVRKGEQNDAILHFVENWQPRTGTVLS